MRGKRRIGKIWNALLLAGVLMIGTVMPAYAENENTESEFVNEDVEYAAGELIVLYREDVSEAQAAEVVEAQGDTDVEIISNTDAGSIAVVSIAGDTSVEEAVQAYEADDRVLAASPNFEMELFGDNLVNDAEYARQNYLQQTNVPQAWNIIKGIPHDKVKVAVLDTGTDITHPDLKGVLNFDSSKEILDENGTLGALQGDGYQSGIYTGLGGHGTHVSGIIAAQANNGQGIAGVASAVDNSVVDLISVDVFSSDKTTNLKYVIKGMEYARSVGAKIINLSLGIKHSSIGSYDSIFRIECNSLASEGIILVCAAGNYGTGDNGKIDVVPADYDTTVGVIALDSNLNKAGDSCYGSLKDISAPGVGIYSTTKGGNYGTMSGTSMAAPEVSGIVAMMCSVNPNLGIKEVKEILKNTATDIGTPGSDIYTGAGVVNAQKAVEDAALYASGKEIILPYGDVQKGDWYYDAVVYMYKNGIMTGLKPDVFGPSSKVSRAQFATILYRMSGAGAVEYSERYPDVSNDTFYTLAALWSAKEGIITGYDNGCFGPADMITREQMATILYRYAGYLGFDCSNKNSLDKFPDGSDVSPFAKEALQWTNAEGIITGNADGTLAARAGADRAACAMMIMRFMEKF